MKGLWLTETAVYPGMTTVMEKGKMKAWVCIPRPWEKGPHPQQPHPSALRGGPTWVRALLPSPVWAVQPGLALQLEGWLSAFVAPTTTEGREAYSHWLGGKRSHPHPTALGFSWVPFPIPWLSPDLWSVSSKQKRACFMPSQIKWHQLRAPSFTLSLKWILAPVTALYPTGGMRWWLARGREWSFFTSKHWEVAVLWLPGGWEDWKN